jgi:hypothetical protein
MPKPELGFVRRLQWWRFEMVYRHANACTPGKREKSRLFIVILTRLRPHRLPRPNQVEPGPVPRVDICDG